MLQITTQYMKKHLLCKTKVLRMDGKVQCFIGSKYSISTSYFDDILINLQYFH